MAAEESYERCQATFMAGETQVQCEEVSTHVQWTDREGEHSFIERGDHFTIEYRWW
jgi:hypothetical protein